MLPNNGKAWQTSATANIILLMHGQLALKREQRGNVCLFARIMRIKHSCLIQRNVLRIRFQFPFHFGFLMDNNPFFLVSENSECLDERMKGRNIAGGILRSRMKLRFIVNNNFYN